MRQTCSGDVIAGHAVRRGDYVWVSPYLVHRDPRFWDEPERFAPSAGSRSRPAIARASHTSPSAPARKCLGGLVGWQAMAATILAVTRRFEPRLVEPVRHDPSRPVRRPRNGIQVVLESRAAAER